MLTVTDFIEKYKLYSDEELFEVKTNIENYSNEAKEALDIVIKDRGGLEKIESTLSGKEIINDEIARIRSEALNLSSKETNAELIKTLLTSPILAEEKVHEIIDEQYSLFRAHINDTAVTSKTVVKAIVGTVVASVLGGVYMGVVLLNSNKIPLLFIIGLLILCYAIIRLITQKSKANNVVFLATLLSFIFSLLIGYSILEIYGISI